MLHKPIEKNWNNLEFKPHGLSLGSLAREGLTVIHTSASYFPIQSFSLGTLPEHFTSKLSVPTPFIIETRSFASSQKFRRRKMTTTQMRLKGEIRGAALPSSHWAWPHQMRFEHDNCCWQLQAMFFLTSGHKHNGRGSTWSHPQHPTGFWSPRWLHRTASHWTDHTTQEIRVHTPLKDRLLQLCLTSHTIAQLLQGKDRYLPWHAVKLASSYTKS